MNTGEAVATEASTTQPNLMADIESILAAWGTMPTDPADFRRALVLAWRLGRSCGIDHSLEVMRGALDHAS